MKRIKPSKPVSKPVDEAARKDEAVKEPQKKTPDESWRNGREGTHVMDIMATDNLGNEFLKHVFLVDHPETGAKIIDFGWPVQYYYDDPESGLLRSHPFVRPLCIDGAGENHKGSAVWVQHRDLNVLFDKIKAVVTGNTLMSKLMSGEFKKTSPVQKFIDRFRIFAKEYLELCKSDPPDIRVAAFFIEYLLFPFTNTDGAEGHINKVGDDKKILHTPWNRSITAKELRNAIAFKKTETTNLGDLKDAMNEWISFLSFRLPSYSEKEIGIFVSREILRKFPTVEDAYTVASHPSTDPTAVAFDLPWSCDTTWNDIHQACLLIKEWEKAADMFESRNITASGLPPKSNEEVAEFEKDLKDILKGLMK